VLLISLDDLNAWVGILNGHPDTRTPNIDRLGSRGVTFSDAHASSPICGPSRAALLSGIRASTSGMHDNKSKFEDHEILMRHQNLPQFFKAHGYGTYTAGKIFHHEYPEFWDELLSRGPRMYQAGEPKRSGLEVPGIFDFGPLDKPADWFDDYRMAQYAIDKLNEDHDKPFFIACGIYLPHVPYYAPEETFEKFPLDEIDMPPEYPGNVADLPPGARRKVLNSYQQIIREWPEQAKRRAVQSYLASVNFADSQVGRILDSLEQSPYAENTIVVLFGDHGIHLGEKDFWHKDVLWQECTRSPLIIHAPGMPGNGVICNRAVSLLDIYPTLAELIGATPPGHLEGRSLLPLLEDPLRPWGKGVITNRRPGEYSLRTDHWTYITYGPGEEELYDRAMDSNEWNNLANKPEYAATKERLARKARELLNQGELAADAR